MIVNTDTRAELGTTGSCVLSHFRLPTVGTVRECILLSWGVGIRGELREMQGGLVTSIPLILQWSIYYTLVVMDLRAGGSKYHVIMRWEFRAKTFSKGCFYGEMLSVIRAYRTRTRARTHRYIYIYIYLFMWNVSNDGKFSVKYETAEQFWIMMKIDVSQDIFVSYMGDPGLSCRPSHWDAHILR
jgi:hypothetical protein